VRSTTNGFGGCAGRGREDECSRGLQDDTAILVDIDEYASVHGDLRTQTCIAICISEEKCLGLTSNDGRARASSRGGALEE
jgi:hypothetical protein